MNVADDVLSNQNYLLSVELRNSYPGLSVPAPHY